MNGRTGRAWVPVLGGTAGCLPAFRTGIDIKGENKWKTIIQNASLNKTVH